MALVFADGGYAGRLVAWAKRVLRVILQIVRKPDSHETMVKWAMIGLMVRRLAPDPGRRAWAPPAPT